MPRKRRANDLYINQRGKKAKTTSAVDSTQRHSVMHIGAKGNQPRVVFAWSNPTCLTGYNEASRSNHSGSDAVAQRGADDPNTNNSQKKRMTLVPSTS